VKGEEVKERKIDATSTFYIVYHQRIGGHTLDETLWGNGGGGLFAGMDELERNFNRQKKQLIAG
jgi:hypothetical protein